MFDAARSRVAAYIPYLLGIVVLVVYAGLIGGLLYGVYRLTSIYHTAVAATGAILGLLVIPIIVYFVGTALPYRGVLARILHTAGAIGRKRTVLVQHGKEYRERAADAVRADDTGEVEAWVTDVQGEAVTIEDGLEHRIKFGKRPLALLPLKNEETFGAWTDGVGTKLNSERDDVGVSMRAVVRRLGSAAGPQLAAAAEEEAKAEYGGGADLGTKWMVVGMLLMAVIGGGLGYVMVM